MITWVMFLAVGILIGVAAGLYFSRLDDAAKRTQDTLSKQLEQKDIELAEYKEQVKSHFVTTAELVNNMTESYRAVHEHLSTGAEGLCKESPNMLSVSFDENTMLGEQSAEADVEANTMLSESIDNEVKTETKTANTDPSEVPPAQSVVVADDREATTDSIDDTNVPTLTAEASELNSSELNKDATAQDTRSSPAEESAIDGDGGVMATNDVSEQSENTKSELSATDELPVTSSQVDVDEHGTRDITADPAVTEMEKSKKDENRVVH